MADQYDWWRKALAGEFGPIHEDEPQSGFFRVQQNKRWQAVAIWRDGDTIECIVGTDEPVDPYKIWTWACRRPIAHELYTAVVERGEAWPDEIPDEPTAA